MRPPFEHDATASPMCTAQSGLTYHTAGRVGLANPAISGNFLEREAAKEIAQFRLMHFARCILPLI